MLICICVGFDLLPFGKPQPVISTLPPAQISSGLVRRVADVRPSASSSDSSSSMPTTQADIDSPTTIDRTPHPLAVLAIAFSRLVSPGYCNAEAAGGGSELPVILRAVRGLSAFGA